MGFSIKKNINYCSKDKKNRITSYAFSTAHSRTYGNGNYVKQVISLYNDVPKPITITEDKNTVIIIIPYYYGYTLAGANTYFQTLYTVSPYGLGETSITLTFGVNLTMYGEKVPSFLCQEIDYRKFQK